jgi:hypothetical protein
MVYCVCAIQTYFHSHTKYRSLLSKCGTQTLTTKLNQILMYHIRYGRMHPTLTPLRAYRSIREREQMIGFSLSSASSCVGVGLLAFCRCVIMSSLRDLLVVRDCLPGIRSKTSVMLGEVQVGGWVGGRCRDALSSVWRFCVVGLDILSSLLLVSLYLRGIWSP